MAEQDVKTQTLCRIIFSSVFIFSLVYNMFSMDKVEAITQEQCMQDQVFIWTDGVNHYLRDHLDIKNRYIIYASFLMDVMLLTFFVVFIPFWKTFRIIFAYIMFFGIRTLIQKNFFMNRIEGFLFFNPGFPSMSVPYHDVNDFFYSGHIGTCFLIVLEYRACKWFKMSYFTVFIMLNQWVMMTLVRTHYIIDLITGLIVSHYVFMLAERIAFFIDAKVFRIPPNKRPTSSTMPCNYCGWNNRYAGHTMCKQEKDHLKNLYKDQNGLRQIKIKFDGEDEILGVNGNKHQYEEKKEDFSNEKKAAKQNQSLIGQYAQQEDEGI